MTTDHEIMLLLATVTEVAHSSMKLTFDINFFFQIMKVVPAYNSPLDFIESTSDPGY